MISKMLGAFKFSEHDRSPNFNTANILNAQIKKDSCVNTNGDDRSRECCSWLPCLPVYLDSHHRINAGLQARKGEYSRQIRCRSPHVTNFGVPKILIIRKIMCFKIWQFYAMPNLSAR